MTNETKTDVPIESQEVRVLTEEENRRIAAKLREDLDLSEGPEVTWDDLAKVVREVLKPKKS